MSPELQEQPRTGVLASLREALAGTERDYTTGSIGRAVFLLSVPMILEMAMESLFGVVDIFFVARLGVDAVNTVGLTESMLTILFGIAMGLSMATTAVIARRTGEKDEDGAAVAAVQSVVLGLAVSLVMGLAGFLFAPNLLALMGAVPSVVATGSTYTRIILSGSGIILMLFLLNGIFRGAGDAAVAMRVLWLANAVNILLVPCLTTGWGPFPELGVTGAAIATTTGRGIGVLYQLYLLFSGRSRVRLRPAHLRVEWDTLARLGRMASEAALQFLIATASWLLMARLVASFGPAAIAGYTIAVRIIIFCILPAWGMANAAATLVGQNLGAGKPDRAEQSVWRTGSYNAIFLGTLAIIFLTIPATVVRLVTDDPAVVSVAANCLRYFSAVYPLFAYGMVIVQAFNGAGDTRTPTWINLFCYWFWQIPLAWALGFPAGLGTGGIFAAVSVAEATLAVVGMYFFRRGAWKLKQV